MHAGPRLHFLQRHDSIPDLLTADVFHNSFIVLDWLYFKATLAASSLTVQNYDSKQK